MAEIAVNIVINKLVPLIAEEAKLLSGIHKEVKNIKDELEIIVAFLKEVDAREARGETNHLIKAWVKQVIDVAYRMEDVMDEYLHNEAQQQAPQTHKNVRKRFSSFLSKTSRSIMKLKSRHELAYEIQDIKALVRDVKERGNGFGLINSTTQGTSSTSTRNVPPIASLFVDEAELVGIELPKSVLASWFAEKQVHRMVFSLVGMGGLGKTTLLKKVFDNQKERFDCHAWITVSQTYSMKELLKSLIQQFHRARNESIRVGMEYMDEVMLIDDLHEFVKEKRYVVAFDDIWHVEFWTVMKHALPDNKNGSRVIFTTRNENVAPSSITSSLNRVHLLQPLSFDEAWKLFCKKVFQSPSNDSHCPVELEYLGKGMVRKCEGLPLAVVAIGGILSTKQKNVFEWQKFHESLETKLENNENLESVTKVLSLSYHDLPYYLKPCLLYFGMFPENYSIRGSRLIRQWTAEGFVKMKGKEIVEEIAEDYLKELVRRNLVQVSQADSFGTGREYQVHDLIRDFIGSKHEEQRFCQVSTKNIGDDQSRRLSMLNNAIDTFGENANFLRVRSVLLFQVLEFPINFTEKLFANFKLLNMLDFEDAPLTFLPDELGSLFHLKYLSIRNTKVKCLPKSIGNLQQLETLDAKHSLIRELPVEIKRLRKIRHLLAYHYDLTSSGDIDCRKGVAIREGLGCHQTLQKLSYVEADGNGIFKELRNFTELRRFGITKVTREDGIDLCIAIENMKQLRSLQILARNKQDFIDLESIVSPPPLLRTLFLYGRLESFPNWISKLENLIRLPLHGCALRNDPLEALQDLPNLLELKISHDAYIGEQLHFREGGFRRLKLLQLCDLKEMKRLVIDEGALSNLEKLYIGPCPLLREVPFGIQHLAKLERVVFCNMPKVFRKSIEGSNCEYIRHVPYVYVGFKCGPHRYICPIK